MAKIKTDAESLFDQLAKVAFEAGLNLGVVKMTNRPGPSSCRAVIVISSSDWMNTRPHHSVLEGIYDT